MALIKCPECGRDNVSDSAESCPNCGYGIKAHFNRPAEKEKQIRLDDYISNSIRSTEEKKFKEYQYEIKAKQAEIDKISAPKKPNFFLDLFKTDQGGWLSYVIIVGPWVTLLFCKLASIDNILLLLYIVLGWIATPIWLFINYDGHKIDVENYNRELKLYNKNRAAWKQEQEQKKARIEEVYKSRAHREAEELHKPVAILKTPQIICPICGSSNVEKISTMDRSVSIAMVGLASGKIGKQYKCKKCKHM